MNSVSNLNKSLSLENSNISSATPENYKNNQGSSDTYFQYDYDAALILLSLAIITTNTLVVFLFVRKYQLRTKTNTLLLSLAVSDILMGALGIPLYIACNSLYITPVCVTAATIYRFIATSTIFHILAITIERYISVIHPLKYFAIVTRNRIMKVILFVWAISLFIALIQLSWTNFEQFRYNPVEVKCNLIYNFLGLVVCFVLPIIAMSVIYYRVFVAIRYQIHEAKKHSVAGQKQSAKPLSAEPRAVMIFALMLSIFVCFWISWYIIALRMYISAYSRKQFALGMDPVILEILTFLRLSTPLVNPVLYTFLKQDFRKALISFIPCNILRRRQNDNGLEMKTLMTYTTTTSVKGSPNLRMETKSSETAITPLFKDRQEV